jgi:hypothetical protein
MEASSCSDIKSAVEDGGSVIHGSGSLGANCDVSKTASASLRSKLVGEDSEVHSTQPPPEKSFWRESVNKLSSVKEADLLYDKLLDINLNLFMKHLEENYPNMKPEDPKFYATLKPKLKGYLKKIQRITNELGDVGKSSARKQKEISENIKPILLESGAKQPL